MILIKFMIFHSIEKGNSPKVKEIENRLVENRDEEKQVSLERNTFSIHLTKWEALESFE